MPGTVHLHQFPAVLLAWPAPAVRRLSPPPLPQPRCQQPLPQRLHRHRQPVLFRQILRGQRRAEIRVALLVQRHDPLPPRILTPIRRPTTQPMHHAAIAFLPITRPQPLHLPIPQAHQLAGLHQRHLAAPDPTQHFQTPPLRITHCQRLHVGLLSEAQHGDISIWLARGHFYL